jgi:signal peptidase II
MIGDEGPGTEATEAVDAVDAAAPPRHPLPGRLVWVVAVGVAAIVTVLDQATKVLAVEALSDRSIDLGVVALRLVRNPNAAFGIPGFPGMFLLITVVVVVLIARLLTHTDRLWLAFAYGLVVGGALGNGLDRAFRSPGFPNGAVVDFVDLGWWPVFNVADSGITVGAALVVILLLRRDREEAMELAAREQAQATSVRPETTPPNR